VFSCDLQSGVKIKQSTKTAS